MTCISPDRFRDDRRARTLAKAWFKLKLGLRVRSEAEWLPSNDLFDNQSARAEQIGLKKRLLAKHHQDVISAMPNTNAAGDEVLAVVCQHLTTYHNGNMHNDYSALSGADLHPLDMAFPKIYYQRHRLPMLWQIT